MTELILFLGAITLTAGLTVLASPEIIFGYLRSHIDTPAIHITAVVVRLIIGVLLLNQSALSRFPLVIEILGCISIVAALSLAVMGRQNFHRLMVWALTVLKPYGRVGGAFAAAFGGFLIYAFI